MTFHRTPEAVFRGMINRALSKDGIKRKHRFIRWKNRHGGKKAYQRGIEGVKVFQREVDPRVQRKIYLVKAAKADAHVRDSKKAISLPKLNLPDIKEDECS